MSALRASEGTFSLAAVDPDDTGGVKRKHALGKLEAKLAPRLADLQERLYAEKRRSLLIVLQAMDAGGKDGTIKHVMSRVNPQGVEVVSFKQPTPAEKRHHFLWRIRRQLPDPGITTIFNRSHYEDVLVPAVLGDLNGPQLDARYREINDFEQELDEKGTRVIKFFMHISRDEQRDRLVDRLKDPQKNWKFRPADLDTRDLWTEYQASYERAIRATSTDAAPWYVVPANSKWYRNWAVATLVADTLELMDPRYPRPSLDIEALERRLLDS